MSDQHATAAELKLLSQIDALRAELTTALQDKAIAEAAFESTRDELTTTRVQSHEALVESAKELLAVKADESRARAQLATLRETHYEGPPDIELDAAKAKLPNWCPVVPLHDEDGTVDVQDRDDGHSHHCVPSSKLAEVREELRLARDWKNVADEWGPAIHDAHPVRSGSHDTYGVAMQMVGHRHSKGELVALVNWLLVRIGKLEAPEPCAQVIDERDKLRAQLAEREAELKKAADRLGRSRRGTKMWHEIADDAAKNRDEARAALAAAEASLQDARSSLVAAVPALKQCGFSAIAADAELSIAVLNAALPANHPDFFRNAMTDAERAERMARVMAKSEAGGLVTLDELKSKRSKSGRLACPRCEEEIAESYQPGRCYAADCEPAELDFHDVAEPWESVAAPPPATNVMVPDAYERAAKEAEQVIFEARTGELDTDLRSIKSELGRRIRAIAAPPPQVIGYRDADETEPVVAHAGDGAPGPPAAPELAEKGGTKVAGTFRCPICGHDKPHTHCQQVVSAAARGQHFIERDLVHLVGGGHRMRCGLPDSTVAQATFTPGLVTCPDCGASEPREGRK
jgi:hypothetical protein